MDFLDFLMDFLNAYYFILPDLSSVPIYSCVSNFCLTFIGPKSRRSYVTRLGYQSVSYNLKLKNLFSDFFAQR